MRPRSPRPGEVISCGGCPARWKGIGVAHCGACHVSFSATRWFDMHRRFGKCLEPIDIRDREGYQLLRQMDDGIWRGPELSEVARAQFGK